MAIIERASMANIRRRSEVDAQSGGNFCCRSDGLLNGIRLVLDGNGSYYPSSTLFSPRPPAVHMLPLPPPSKGDRCCKRTAAAAAAAVGAFCNMASDGGGAPILCLNLDNHLIGIRLDPNADELVVPDEEEEEDSPRSDEEEYSPRSDEEVEEYSPRSDEEDAPLPKPKFAFVIDLAKHCIPFGMGFFRLESSPSSSPSPLITKKKMFMVGGEIRRARPGPCRPPYFTEWWVSDLVYEFDPFNDPQFKTPSPGTMPPIMCGPKASPVVETYGNKVYVLNTSGLFQQGKELKEPSFEVLELHESGEESPFSSGSSSSSSSPCCCCWRWRPLPPPPFHYSVPEGSDRHRWFKHCQLQPHLFFHCVIGHRLVIHYDELLLVFDFEKERWVVNGDPLALGATNLEKRIHISFPDMGKCIPCDFPGFFREDGSRVVLFVEDRTPYLCAYLVDDSLHISVVQVLRDIFRYARKNPESRSCTFKLLEVACGRMCAILYGISGFLAISIFDISFREDYYVPHDNKGTDVSCHLPKKKPSPTFCIRFYRPSHLPQTEFLQVHIVKEYCCSLFDFCVTSHSTRLVDAFFA